MGKGTADARHPEKETEKSDWLYSQPLTNPPTMVSVMSHIADGKNLESRWQKISNLKTQAKVLIFLQQNGIRNISQLDPKKRDSFMISTPAKSNPMKLSRSI